MDTKFCLDEPTTIRFPIGDWSDDGHGKCEYFFVSCNKSVQQLREIHFSCPAKLGFDIGDMCSEYQEPTVSSGIIKMLEKHNIVKPNELSKSRYDFMSPIYLFKLWLIILKFLEPSLTYEIYEPKFIDINFYGFDEQKRHLNTPGYGLYE